MYSNSYLKKKFDYFNVPDYVIMYYKYLSEFILKGNNTIFTILG